MGQRPLTLRYLKSYVTAVRALLAGETTVVDGQPVRMLHAEDLAAPRPVDVEIWLSVFGPRGIELATEIADGIIGLPMQHTLPIATLMPGTVLQPGEDRRSDRVRKRRAHGRWSAITRRIPSSAAEAVDAMPGGRAWRDALEDLAPEGERHLFTHQGHVTHLTERDHVLLDEAPDGMAVIGSAEEIGLEWLCWRNRVCRKSSTRLAVPRSPGNWRPSTPQRPGRYASAPPCWPESPALTTPSARCHRRRDTSQAR